MGLSLLIPLFASVGQLPPTGLPAQIRSTFVVGNPALIKGQTVRLSGTEEQPAILALEGKNTVLEDCTFELSGEAWVILYRADGATVRNCTFRGGSNNQLKIVRANNVTVEGSKFYGEGNNTGPLLEINPGHPWQFTDAFRYSSEYVAHTKYLGGMNRFQHTNFLGYERIAHYDGGPTVKVTYTHKVEPAFHPRSADKNRWFVWGPDRELHELEFISANDNGFVLNSNGKVPVGPIRYLTYNPEALMTGFVLRNSVFTGPGKSSGFSGYALDGALLEGNQASGFSDYGLGYEFSTRSVMRGNKAWDNQKYWDQNNQRMALGNQLEVVAPVGPTKLEKNEGKQTDVRHWHPFAFPIESDNKVDKQYPAGRTW